MIPNASGDVLSVKTKFVALRWRFCYLPAVPTYNLFSENAKISNTFLEKCLLRGSPTTPEGILFFSKLLFCGSLYVDSALKDFSLSVEAMLADFWYSD